MTGRSSEDANPVGDIVRLTMAAQERSLNLAQAWSNSLLDLVREQGEGQRAVLTAVTSSLAAMERALAAQEEANRALQQSLEAYREVIQRAGAAQEQSVRLVETAVSGFAAAIQGQLDTARAMMAAPAAATEPFGELMREWNATVQRMFQAAFPYANPAGTDQPRPGGS